MDEVVFMSDIAYKYCTQLDSLDLSDLEMLFDKISLTQTGLVQTREPWPFQAL